MSSLKELHLFDTIEHIQPDDSSYISYGDFIMLDLNATLFVKSCLFVNITAVDLFELLMYYLNKSTTFKSPDQIFGI